MTVHCAVWHLHLSGQIHFHVIWHVVFNGCFLCVAAAAVAAAVAAAAAAAAVAIAAAAVVVAGGELYFLS